MYRIFGLGSYVRPPLTPPLAAPRAASASSRTFNPHIRGMIEALFHQRHIAA